MAEEVFGKWQKEGETNLDGLDDYLAASGQTDKRDDHFKPYTMEVSREEDEFIIVSKVEGKPAETERSKIGVVEVKDEPGIGKVENLCQPEGNKWMMVSSMGGSEVHRAVQYVEEGQLVLELSAGGKMWKSRLTRI